MKKFFFLLCTLFAVGIACCGCNDDKKDDNNNDSSIVGTWQCKFSSGYQQYIFNTNGTGSLFEIDHGELDYAEYFTYQLQGTILILTYTENDEADVEVFSEVTIKGNTMRWIDLDGDPEVLYRVK